MSLTTVADQPPAVNPDPARFPTCPICQQAAVNVMPLFIKVEVLCSVCGWEALIVDTPALRDAWHTVLRAGIARLATVYGMGFPPTVLADWFAHDQPLRALDSVEYYLQECGRETERHNPAVGLAWVTIRNCAAQRECAWMRQQVWAAIAPHLADTQEAA